MADDHAPLAALRPARRFRKRAPCRNDRGVAKWPARECPAARTFRFKRLPATARQLFLTTVTIELSLVLLAAPAATAGAVCLDKARGTLDHMLATDLSNAEIVLGKLGVRLIPVLGLIACVLPLSALTSLLGGIDPTALFGSFLTSIACAILGCSLAMALSVWGRKTHEVLMVTYLILIIWLGSPLLVMILAQAFGGPLAFFDSTEHPRFDRSHQPVLSRLRALSLTGKSGMTTFLAFLGSCLLFSGLLVALAAWRIRAVALKQAGRAAAPSRAAVRSRLPQAGLAPAAAGPVARWQPGPLARVAALQAVPIPARGVVLVYAPWA